MTETRILVFSAQADAATAVAKISATMGLRGSTFLFAIPAELADGRWFIPYPGDAAWLAGVTGFTVAQGLGMVAVGEAVPDRPFVPPAITNVQARATLLQMPSATGQAGRSLFDDVDDAMHAAGGLELQFWEYANELYRDSDLVRRMGGQLGLTDSQMNQFFIAAGAVSA